jgi:hypothetical protein
LRFRVAQRGQYPNQVFAGLETFPNINRDLGVLMVTRMPFAAPNTAVLEYLPAEHEKPDYG